MNKPRITIHWTDNAKDGLSKMPGPMSKGMAKKADSLLRCDDPRKVGKPLRGILHGFYSLRFNRYRALYSVKENLSPDGKSSFSIEIVFVLVGMREEGSRSDVYNEAEKNLDNLQRMMALWSVPYSDDDLPHR